MTKSIRNISVECCRSNFADKLCKKHVNSIELVDIIRSET